MLPADFGGSPYGSYDAYPYQELRSMLASGQVATIRDMARRWRSVSRKLDERAAALSAKLDALDQAWDGKAARTYISEMRRLQHSFEDGKQRALRNYSELEDAADALGKAQANVPGPTSLRANGFERWHNVLTTTSEKRAEMQAYEQDKRVVIDRLHQIDSGYSGSGAGLRPAPTYQGPPPTAVGGRGGFAAGEVSGDSAGGDGRGGYSGIDGGAGHTGSGSPGSGFGAFGGGGSAGSGGAAGDTGGSGRTTTSGGPVTGSPPGTSPSPIPGPPRAPLPSPFPAPTPGPVLGSPGATGTLPARPSRSLSPGQGGPGGLARGGVLGGRTPGGVLGRGGTVPGGGVGGPGGVRGAGVSGRLGPGGVLGAGSGSPGGPGGAAARTAMAGRGMPTGVFGRGGKGDEDEDRRRWTWLQETEDVWHGDQHVAPAVLGGHPDRS